jgi:hypothetical protein
MRCSIPLSCMPRYFFLHLLNDVIKYYSTTIPWSNGPCFQPVALGVFLSTLSWSFVLFCSIQVLSVSLLVHTPHKGPTVPVTLYSSIRHWHSVAAKLRVFATVSLKYITFAVSRSYCLDNLSFHLPIFRTRMEAFTPSFLVTYAKAAAAAQRVDTTARHPEL